LVGRGGLAPLHLAARSIEIEEDTKKEVAQSFSNEKVSGDRFELGEIFRYLFLNVVFDITVPIKPQRNRT
jgi:hypothetical protein